MIDRRLARRMTWRGLPAAALLGVASAGAAADCPDPSTGPCRVGGDLEARAEASPGRDGSVTWRSGRCRIDTPLPDGYPPPTPPGALEIKAYPVVRRAVTSAGGGGNGGFWPLFNHIKSRDIAMTSPVEMDYAGLRPGSEPGGSDVTMAFLYRHADQGPEGTDGRVEVRDAPAQTVLAFGLRGRHGTSEMLEALDRLGDWLDRSPDWELAGDARALHYNGPMTWPKWSEVQVPIRRLSP